MAGRIVEFGRTTPFKGYLATPVDGVGPAVVVLHAWWGLNDFFKGVCDRLAGEGFVAFAPDLYDGKVAETIDDAAQLMESSDYAAMREAVLEAAHFAIRQPEARPIGLGVIGFSMGASWAALLAALRPGTVRAAVLFYGTETEDLSASRAAFLGHFCPEDEWEPREGVEALEQALRAAGRDVEFHYYPEAGHWFVEANQPDAYAPEAAELAWERTLAFLRARLPEQDEPLPRSAGAMMELINTGWNELQAAIEVRTPEELTRLGPDGWSAKEHIAHVTFWEHLMLQSEIRGETRESVTGLDAATLDSIDAVNAAAAERARRRSLNEVLAESRATHAEVVAELTSRPFEEWLKPRFPDDPDERPLILWIAGNTWGHYGEHAEYIRRLFQAE
jgi:carboxymethylenebutenolidase